MNVLERIDFECEVSNDVKDLFSKNHVKYDCYIEYNGFGHHFTYQCNKKDTPKKEEVIACLTSDADGFDCVSDFEDFCDVFGYTKINQYNEAMKSYNACKSVFEYLNDTFTSEEREELDELLEDYR